MNRRRFLAIIMSVFMILSLLPVTVFAETTAAVLDGQLKIQGTAVAGTTLKADMQGIKNEGITEDSVSYQWFRKTSDDEKKEQQGEKPELKSLSKEKTYTITKDDIDSKIVLTITGLEDKGFSGSLTAVTATVTETADPKAAETEQNTEASTEEQNQDTSTAEDASSEETQEIPEAANDNEAGSESVDGIPAATNDAESSEQENENSEEELEQNEYQEELQPADETGSTEKNEQDSEEAGSTSVEGIPEAKEDGTYNNTEDNTETESPSDTDEASYQAEAEVGDGSSDVLAFGTVVSGQEDEQAQYVTIKNTGTETLNFIDISPEHFAVQDITEPLEAGQSVQVWIAQTETCTPNTRKT